MKVTGVRCIVVGNPPPHFGGRYFVLLQLDTDAGLRGLGEVYCAAFAPAVVTAMVEDVVARHLEGREPFGVEALFRRILGSGFSLRADPTLMAVASGIEMACWDLIGKALERPVYDLLGGRVHERLRTYSYLYPEADDATDVYADPDLAAARAASYVARGFTAVKCDPAGPYTIYDGHQPSLADLERVATFFARLREAVGDDADLLLGTHGQFTASGALRLVRRVADQQPLWFEEPVPPEDLDGLARVVAGSAVPVATGERLTTKHEFLRVLRAGVDILQPNLGRCGGLLEGKKIAALAEAHNAQIAPHLYNGPVTAAANVQLATCSPNFLILEGIGDFSGFHADLLEVPLRWEDGYLTPPTAPGLGIELNEAVARAHPYEDTALHLTMSEQPPG